jgi:WD40 repeat protein
MSSNAAERSRSISSFPFSPDGRLALSASSDGTLRLWDVRIGRTVHVLAGHSSGVMDCAFSPEGRPALSASRDNTLRLWEVASGRKVGRFSADADLSCCAFKPQGWQLMAGDVGGAVHFLTIMRPEELGIPAVPEAEHEVQSREPPTKSGRRRWWPFGRRR